MSTTELRDAVRECERARSQLTDAKAVLKKARAKAAKTYEVYNASDDDGATGPVWEEALDEAAEAARICSAVTLRLREAERTLRLTGGAA